jgi:hypothetical protein
MNAHNIARRVETVAGFPNGESTGTLLLRYTDFGVDVTVRHRHVSGWGIDW